MRSIITNPIKLFAFIVILLSLILLIGCQFHCPDIYFDREALGKIYNQYHDEISYTSAFINFDYYKYNLIFHQLGFWISALLFVIIFKINNFKKFLELKIFNNKKLIYIWINILYLIGGFLYFTVYKIHYNFVEPLDIYEDYIIQVILLGGIIYYSIFNYLTYITFNTNIKRNLYKYSWIFLLILLILTLIKTFTMKFIFISILLDFCYVMLFIYIIQALRYLRNKEQIETPEDSKELIPKYDIFIYFLIAAAFTLISFMPVKIYSWDEILLILIAQAIYTLPVIFALIINFVVKKFKIQNESKRKVIKKIVNILSNIYIVFILVLIITVYILINTVFVNW